MDFEPKILAFLCTWCSYTGADTAGIARLKSPANIRDVRVPCSGRVSPEQCPASQPGPINALLPRWLTCAR